MDSLEAFSGTYAEQLVNRAQQKRVPISGTFELTPVCNMRCRMCYIQHTPKREELQPYEFWADVLEQAMAQGKRRAKARSRIVKKKNIETQITVDFFKLNINIE